MSGPAPRMTWPVQPAGEGGFVTRLGDAELFNPQLAEVYTFPTGTALREGDVQTEPRGRGHRRPIAARISRRRRLQKSGRYARCRRASFCWRCPIAMRLVTFWC